MSFTVGENVGPYRIVEQLGQGGMATVFKAYHASLDRYVAIKVLHPAFNEDKTFASRFQREARVVARLEHPNIVPVYDYAEHENRPYLVMKFIEGDTLKDRMSARPLSAEEINQVVDAVGSSLAYAHKQGILHRDIKPSNVLTATDGQIYLADFGLARIAQSGESTLSSDMIMGTPQYISPEQAMGKKDLDAGTDIYSFGVMIYELVVGKVPFSADTPFAIIHDHIYTPLPLPHTVNPNVPEKVERVLLKALAKDRGDRYTDVLTMVGAFKTAWNEAGAPVPMAEVKPQPVPIATPTPQVETKTARAPERTEVAAPTATATVKARVAESDPVAAKKRSPWTWVSIGVIILLCLGLAWTARSNRWLAKLIRARNETPTAAALPPVNTSLPPTANLPADTPLPTQPAPADAEAHLNLALEAWEQNDLKRSMAELELIVTQSPGQLDLFTDAGARLADAGQYVGAAYMYAHAALLFKDAQQPLPPTLRDPLEESFYFAVEEDGFPLYISFETLRNNDPPLALFSQSRYALLHGNTEVAHQNLNELLRLQPQWPMAQLLKAEILIHDGNTLEPRKILQDLIASPRTQPWVKDQADVLLNKIP